MLEQDTFRRTSRAGSIHDAAKVLGRWRNRLDWVGLTNLRQLIKTHHIDVREIGFDFRDETLFNLAVVVVYHVLDGAGVFEAIDQSLEQVRVEEDGLGLRLDQRVSQTFLSEGIVCGDNRHGL